MLLAIPAIKTVKSIISKIWKTGKVENWERSYRSIITWPCICNLCYMFQFISPMMGPHSLIERTEKFLYGQFKPKNAIGIAGNVFVPLTFCKVTFIDILSTSLSPSKSFALFITLVESMSKVTSIGKFGGTPLPSLFTVTWNKTRRC